MLVPVKNFAKKGVMRKGQVSPDKLLSPLGFMVIMETRFGGPEELNVK